MTRRNAADRVYEGRPIIDSRDIIERLAELQDDADAPEEYAKLVALVAEASNVADDWAHGAALIADHYFETYAQELAEDIGAVPRDLAWPACHIDWTAAAEALKMEYSSVTYGTTEYWVRS